jgi:hypothetical protein
MNYYAKIAVGLVLLLGGAGVFGYCIYELASIGTCASGGPYVSARECPAGTATLMWTATPAILVAIAGAGVLATRGRRATAPGLPPAPTT